jgi:peptidyl-prolyl cis-trans isomerase SurA
MMRSVAAALMILIFWVGEAQKSRKKPSPEVLFSVNNRPVLTNEFSYLYKKNHQNQKEDFTREKIDEYLQLFINFKLKVEEARARGLDTTRIFITEFNTYKDELRRPYLPEGRMLDSLVMLTYNRLKEEVRASHILIGIKPDATPADTLEAYRKIADIRSRAQAGEDFGMLASTYSEDPSARTNKGDLGYFTALQMVYPFENAAYLGKPGDIVGPVRTRFGFHLVKIFDRKPARGEVEVSHIMIRTGADKDETQARNLVFEIYDQLKGGVPWEDLCAQHSEDANSKGNGGRLRPFGVGAMAAAPEFDQVAFALQQPGDISDPFQTAYGWHIVRLERKIPLPSFEELATSLKPRVQRDERVQLSRKALNEKLKKEFTFRENETVKASTFSLADTTLTKGKWKVTSLPGSETIFSLKGKSISANDFVQYIKIHQRASTASPGQYIGQLYEGFVESVMNEAYEEQLVKRNPDYEMLVKEYYEGILLFDIMEKEVWNKASEDTLGQRSFFNSHSSNYKAGERVVAEIFSSTVKENLTELAEALQVKDTLRVQELVRARKVRQENGTFQRADRPVLSLIAWSPGDHTAENSGMYYLVRILNILAPGPMSFEEAKAAVISDYQNYLEKNWVEQLRKKYPVKINEKEKQKIYKQLVRS